MKNKPKSIRGFALMSPEERRANASRAGKLAQATGRAHQFTSEEAKAANQKSMASKRKKQALTEKRGKSLRAALAKEGLVMKTKNK